MMLGLRGGGSVARRSPAPGGRVISLQQCAACRVVPSESGQQLGRRPLHRRFLSAGGPSAEASFPPVPPRRFSTRAHRHAEPSSTQQLLFPSSTPRQILTDHTYRALDINRPRTFIDPDHAMEEAMALRAKDPAEARRFADAESARWIDFGDMRDRQTSATAWGGTHQHQHPHQHEHEYQQQPRWRPTTTYQSSFPRLDDFFDEAGYAGAMVDDLFADGDDSEARPRDFSEHAAHEFAKSPRRIIIEDLYAENNNDADEAAEVDDDGDFSGGFRWPQGVGEGRVLLKVRRGDELLQHHHPRPRGYEEVMETTAAAAPMKKMSLAKAVERTRRPMTTYERQVALEEEVISEACADYKRMVADMNKMGRSGSLGPVQRLLVSWYTPLCQACVAEQAVVQAGATRSRDRAAYGPLLLKLTPEQLAVITMHAAVGASLRNCEDDGAKFASLCFDIGDLCYTEHRVLALRRERGPYAVKAFAEGSRLPGASSDTTRNNNNNNNETNTAKTMQKMLTPADVKTLSGLTAHTLKYRAKKAAQLDAQGSDSDDAVWSVEARAKLGAALLLHLLRVAVDPETQEPCLEHVVIGEKAADHQRGGGASSSSSSSSSSSNKKHLAYRRVGYVRPTARLRSLADTDSMRETALHPRYLPMVVQPEPWRGYDKGGFLRLHAVSMRTRGCRVQVDVLKRAGGEVRGFYEGLDALGKVPWAINRRVFGLIKEAWEARDESVPEFPAFDNTPLPEAPPDDCDWDTRLLFTKRLKRAEKKNRELHSLRCDLKLKLSIADRFVNEPELFFPYNVDFRGRAYPVPPNLNHLGSDVCRAVLQFAEAKPLGPNGLDWLYVHVANLFGHSKLPFDDRRAFARDHLDQIRDSARRPLDGAGWWKGADEPWQALACCIEIDAALETGNPAAYECFLPVHADGSCNGLQHYAALGRDRDGGEQVNLVPGDRPRDVYAGVCDLVIKRVARDLHFDDPADEAAFEAYLKDRTSDDVLLKNKSKEEKKKKKKHQPQPQQQKVDEDESESAQTKRRKRTLVLDPAMEKRLMARMVEGMIARKVVKQTVMTSVYGVTFIGARNQVMARLEDMFADVLAHPQDHPVWDARLRALGVITADNEIDEDEVYRAASYTARLTLDCIGELFSSAKGIMDWLTECARVITAEGAPVSWVTPLGLPVIQPYRRDASHTVRTALQNITLVEHSDELPVHVSRQKSAFPPNFVHSLDSTHMLMTALEMDKRGLTFTAVHDSYWTHATDVPVMNSVLRDAFVDLYSRPILEDLETSLVLRHPGAHFPPLPDRGRLDIRDVKGAEYFFS